MLSERSLTGHERIDAARRGIDLSVTPLKGPTHEDALTLLSAAAVPGAAAGGHHPRAGAGFGGPTDPARRPRGREAPGPGAASRPACRWTPRSPCSDRRRRLAAGPNDMSEERRQAVLKEYCANAHI